MWFGKGHRLHKNRQNTLGFGELLRSFTPDTIHIPGIQLQQSLISWVVPPSQ